ncbi:MAG: YlxR family protein [Chloroflexi bacterium]|nr:YlxR family protein [Chloroflexota bacterium]
MSTTTRTTSSAGERRLPQRTCVGCRRTGDQLSFVRLVRVSAGGSTRVEVDDAPRRTAGRGAYLCRDQQCWERGLKGALAASLRATLDAPNREVLRAYAEHFAATRTTATTGDATRAPDRDREGEDS